MLTVTIDLSAVAYTFAFNVLCFVAGMIVGAGSRNPAFTYKHGLVFCLAVVSLIASVSALGLAGIGIAFWAGVLSLFGSAVFGYSLYHLFRGW